MYILSFCALITPYAFLNQIKDDGHKGVIATAGSSATGRALLELAHLKGIPAIGIVRSEKSKTELENSGLSNILASDTADFNAQFEALASKLAATAVFEGVGGDIVTRIAPLMPGNSTFYFYGFLAGGASFTIQSRMLLEKGMLLRGFSNFGTKTVTDHEILAISLAEITSIIDRPNFRTPLGPRFRFEQVNDALNYASQSGEKCVLVSRDTLIS